MKRFFLFAMAAAMVCALSCKKDKDQPSKTYLQILKEDVAECLVQYPEFKKQGEFEYPYGYFREADYTLNADVTDLSADQLKAVKVVYGFAYNREEPAAQVILEATRNFETGAEMSYDRAEMSGYPQDVAIIENLDKIITLENAIKRVKMANVPKPETNKVSLIHSAIPEYGYKVVYRFVPAPDDDFVVCVNAETGEVFQVEK